MKRAPNETMILALITCELDEGVCEICASQVKREQLETVWIGQGSQEEGLDVCQACIKPGRVI